MNFLGLDGKYAVVMGISPNTVYIPLWFLIQLLNAKSVTNIIDREYGNGSAKLICEIDDDFWFGEYGPPIGLKRTYSDLNAGKSMLLADCPSEREFEKLDDYNSFLSKKDFRILESNLSRWNSFSEFGEGSLRESLDEISQLIGENLIPDVYLRMSTAIPRIPNIVKELTDNSFKYNETLGINEPSRPLIVPVCNNCQNTNWRIISSRVKDSKITWNCRRNKTYKTRNPVTNKELIIRGCSSEGEVELEDGIIDFRKYPVGNVMRGALWGLFTWPSSSYQQYAAEEFGNLMRSTKSIVESTGKSVPVVCSPTQVYDPEFGSKPGEEVSVLRLLEKYGQNDLWDILEGSLKLRRWDQ